MGKLKRSYEISVWDDVWDSEQEKFVERLVGIIGGDAILSKNKAINPTITRNVNGTKKLTFQMQRYYYDENGNKIENAFINWLVNERKVKLHYKDKWYDFVIKNISENSSNYLYTYQLEDALVQELSRNGFGITLHTELMNNMGTAEELGRYVLKETDWQVSSEALVEKIEDNLVYVLLPEDLSGLNIYKITDQRIVPGENNGQGVTPVLLTETEKRDLQNKEILAFYSSCSSKPHLFQFIYLPAYASQKDGVWEPSVSVDENQIINVQDCQYYCEIDKPETAEGYRQIVDIDGNPIFPQFTLPKGFSIVDKGSVGVDNGHDATISVWYRGNRYGFSQTAKFIPSLERYCNKYIRGDEEYYGFVDNEYCSPVLLQNIITNTEFKTSSGWIGTYECSSGEPNAITEYGAQVDPVFGRFVEENSIKSFSSVIDELSNGKYNNTIAYTPYLKVTFPQHNEKNKSVVINTGFYDNRTLIGQVDYEEEWYFEPKILDLNGNVINDPISLFDFYLREASFNPITGGYNINDIWAELVSKTINGKNVYCFKFNSKEKSEDDSFADVKTSKEDFKKTNVKLVIIPKSHNEQTYYIENMQLFKLVLNDKNEIIKPGEIDTEGVVNTVYKFFPTSDVENVLEESNFVAKTDDLIEYDSIDKSKLDYSVYKPVYNNGAQRVRSVDAKESNYFNILQSIAEKFEAWLELEISRDDEGRIINKIAKFKNYAGKDSYVSFRYGVNLKDIQRTYESKNIVTKLIVKQNSNENATDGFCTIARASTNQTGENYIYDFRYYHDCEMLKKDDYMASVYYSRNIYDPKIEEAGPDVDGNLCANPAHHGEVGHVCFNLQNYFNRIKNLNVKIQNLNSLLTPKQTELTKLNAELAVQNGLYEASSNGIESTREDFQTLTGLTPETISLQNVEDTTCSIPAVDSEDGINTINFGNWIKNAQVDATKISKEKWQFTIKLADGIEPSVGDRPFYIQPTFVIQFLNGSSITRTPKIECVMPKEDVQSTKEYTISLVDTKASSVQSLLTEYATYMTEYHSSNDKIYGYNKNGISYQGLREQIDDKEAEITKLSDEIETLKQYKQQLNKLFYTKYSRFIKEGTWIDEKYVDDDKYYIDAQSVMYNSCYPQVAYTINVVALDALLGHEDFVLELGDKTYVIDPDFFGQDCQEEVTINEIIENLDNPDKDQIKVQNFKNQFQDLFQKIVATVQQTQYSTGSYEKAAALAEASAQAKMDFLQDALNSAHGKLTAAGQTTVVKDVNGLTLTDSATGDQMRLIGGAILMNIWDKKSASRKWKTGLTPDGISADFLKAGTIDTTQISIRNGHDITFMWNSFGISAFDTNWSSEGVGGTINKHKFVRFDKYGLYGINDEQRDESNNYIMDGTTWTPTSNTEINSKATFALTWEGLKVTGDSGVEARVGKLGEYILNITKKEDTDDDGIDEEISLMSFSTSGTLTVGNWSVSQDGLQSIVKQTPKTWGLRAINTSDDVPSIYLSSQGRELSLEQFTQNEDDKDQIVFKAGDNFYVSNEGILYAKNGIFSGVINANQGGNLAGWTIAPSDEENSGYNSGIFHDVEFGGEKPKKYRFGMKIGTGCPKQHAWYVREFQRTQGGESWETDEPTGEVIYSVSFDGTLKATKGTIGPLQIESIPEEGYMASSVDNNFSWRFSPSDGMFMWNGKQQEATSDNKTAGAIFAIYNNGTEEAPDYKLSMKGDIYAEGGYIAGYKIEKQELSLSSQVFHNFYAKSYIRDLGIGYNIYTDSEYKNRYSYARIGMDDWNEASYYPTLEFGHNGFDDWGWLITPPASPVIQCKFPYREGGQNLTATCGFRFGASKLYGADRLIAVMQVMGDIHIPSPYVGKIYKNENCMTGDNTRMMLSEILNDIDMRLESLGV